MGSIIGLLILFLATLTMGGCAGLLNGLGSGYGYGMNGYGGAYGAAATAPMALDPAYAAAATAGGYLPQTQPYYMSQPYVNSYNGAAAYTPNPPGVAGAQMRAYGNLSPQERARLTAMQNRASGGNYRARYNGMVRAGTLTPPTGHGPRGLTAQPGTNSASTPAQVRPQAPGYGQRSQLLPNLR